jgi:hypothetical protein
MRNSLAAASHIAFPPQIICCVALISLIRILNLLLGWDLLVVREQ